MSAITAELDAQARRVLAHAAEQREAGQAETLALLPLAGDLAAELRAWFPGRDAENARVLALATSALAETAAVLTERGTDALLVALAVVELLGLTAGELDTGEPAADGEPGR